MTAHVKYYLVFLRLVVRRVFSLFVIQFSAAKFTIRVSIRSCSPRLRSEVIMRAFGFKIDAVLLMHPEVRHWITIVA